MERHLFRRSNAFIPERMHWRSLGANDAISKKVLYRKLTKSFKKFHSFNPHQSLPVNVGLPGAIFNISFSHDGRSLVAACEKRTILILDSRSHKVVEAIKNAHDDCVNCIHFLDTNYFASASDDSTVSLWDCRNLSQQFNVLEGHTDWVKNVEYNPLSRQIITSSFDNSIKVWNASEWSRGGDNTHGSNIVHIDHLMRTRLSPCLTKMIITTTNGISVIIHNLNIDELFENPVEFDWDDTTMYRPNAMCNSVEVVDDFPKDSNSFCISSAAIHPHGWAMLSRFTDISHSAEWSVLHDIQDQHCHSSECWLECTKERTPRLQYYIEEPNVGRGFIKEQCFSSDGRIICSPFGNGIRLFAFDRDCSELSACNWNFSSSREFTEVKTLICHKAPVLTSQFSPTTMLLATGCLGGKVVFSQSKL